MNQAKGFVAKSQYDENKMRDVNGGRGRELKELREGDTIGRIHLIQTPSLTLIRASARHAQVTRLCLETIWIHHEFADDDTGILLFTMVSSRFGTKLEKC